MATRIQNVKRNFTFNVIKTTVQLILQFVLRTILIYIFGKEYLGLNGLFTNILGVLNLAELGIGSAISFSLYKPIADNDTAKINSLIALYRKFYLIIAIIVSAAGLGVMPFLTYFIEGGYPTEINIYIVYFAYLLNTVISYFAAHKRSLIYANQRTDIESKLRMICVLCLNIVQIILIFIFRNYYAYILVMPLFTLIENILIFIIANKLFPTLKEKANKLDSESRRALNKKILAMSLHQIGAVLVLSTDNILISKMFGLAEVGIYSNYLLIITNLINVIVLITNSLQASIGNMIATTNPDYVYERYKKINFAFIWLIAWCAICLICLFQPFILIWTRSADYLFPFVVVIALAVSFYIKENLGMVVMFKTTAQLVWQDRFSPIIQGVTNIIVSIAFAKFFGVVGIFMGTIISTLVAPFWWAPTVLFKHYFKKPVIKYWIDYFIITIFALAIGVGMYFICYFIPSGIYWFILKAALCFIIPNVVFFALFHKQISIHGVFKLLKTKINN